MDDEELQQIKYNQMTTGSVEKLICKMAIPTIVSMLITAFYNMVDTFFMGKINASATAAVGVIFSLMAILQAVGFFFGHGSGNYISRKLGERDTENASQMASVGFFSAFGIGIVLAVCGMISLTPLARILGATDTILPYAIKYMRIILIGAPFMVASLVLNNQLRLQGNALYAMIGITTGAVLNLILDPILIFTFGMGISGAALATTFSQIVSFFILLICCKRSSSITIELRYYKPSIEKIIAIVQGGLPSLCRQGLASVATILLNQSIGIYGDAAVAAMSIVMRVTNFAGAALLGFGQGFQPVCGFNYGAKLYDRVNRAFWFCVKSSSVFLVALAVSGFIFAPEIISTFCKNDITVLQVGVKALRLQCLSFPILGWVILSNMMLQNINKYKEASILSMARQGLFFIPLVLILPSVCGLLGAQLCQPISDLLTFLLSIPMVLRVLKNIHSQ